jgi:hypothetical protein
MTQAQATSSGRLHALYARVPAIECKGLCHDACGPILMSQQEARTIGHPNDMGDWECPKLSPLGTCSVYEDRPMVCRLWGVVESMPCPHGCVPERWLTHDEGHER